MTLKLKKKLRTNISLLLIIIQKEIQFNNTPLVVEENNYEIKNVNAYIIYDLDNWPKTPLINFRLINCLFVATTIVKKSMCILAMCILAFDGRSEWNFVNDFTRNVAIFDVDNSSSSHNNNCKDNFLVLGKGDTFGINRNLGATEKRFSINFSEAIRHIFA